jgi:apocytochrome f
MGLGVISLSYGSQPAVAYPIFAQQAYNNPREATGRIVCANCHLATKPTFVDVPQAVLPDSVFEAVVSIPYNLDAQQILGNGTVGSLNVGAVMVLPENFVLAPKERLSLESRLKTKGVFFSSYSESYPNILVVGPIDGLKNQKIYFPILAPDPKQTSTASFQNYPIYVGGNRGRGQIYQNGEKSNNNIFAASVSGRISSILVKGESNVITVTQEDGTLSETILPSALNLSVSVGEIVNVGQPLTFDPNVGGFGQIEASTVLQNPTRIKGMIFFFISVIVTQILLVIKKKQFEKVQAAEMNF